MKRKKSVSNWQESRGVCVREREREMGDFATFFSLVRNVLVGTRYFEVSSADAFWGLRSRSNSGHQIVIGIRSPSNWVFIYGVFFLNNV